MVILMWVDFQNILNVCLQIFTVKFEILFFNPSCANSCSNKNVYNFFYPIG